jgi:hypothetical protein
MRTHTPGRTEFRPGRRDDVERGKRRTFGNAPQDVERGRIGPVQILDCQDDRLHLGPGQHPFGQSRQLPPAQILGGQRRNAFLRKRYVEERRQ